MTKEDLLVAAAKGDATQIAELLRAGVDPNAVDERIGHSALYNATYTDHVDAINVLLGRGADPNLRLNYRSPVDGREERGIVALMFALSVGAARALLSAGAEVNLADAAGITPLIRAVHRGKLDVVRLLLDSGADARQTTAIGQSAMEVAQAQIARYESWVIAGNRDPIAEKVERLNCICAILAEAIQTSSMPPDDVDRAE